MCITKVTITLQITTLGCDAQGGSQGPITEHRLYLQIPGSAKLPPCDSSDLHSLQLELEPCVALDLSIPHTRGASLLGYMAVMNTS